MRANPAKNRPELPVLELHVDLQAVRRQIRPALTMDRVRSVRAVGDYGGCNYLAIGLAGARMWFRSGPPLSSQVNWAERAVRG